MDALPRESINLPVLLGHGAQGKRHPDRQISAPKRRPANGRHLTSRANCATMSRKRPAGFGIVQFCPRLIHLIELHLPRQQNLSSCGGLVYDLPEADAFQRWRGVLSRFTCDERGGAVAKPPFESAGIRGMGASKGVALFGNRTMEQQTCKGKRKKGKKMVCI